MPKVSAPLVDTRTIVKAPTFTSEHKDWPWWSFQFVAYLGSANPKSIEAMLWAAMEDRITAAAVTQQSFDEHDAQLYLALAPLCKGKCSGDREEHRSQQWTGSVARIERYVR